MPMIDCPDCGGLGGFSWPLEDGGSPWFECGTCHGTGRVPDDNFPSDSEELRDVDEEPETLTEE